MYTVKKKFKFECAHRLFGYKESVCQNLHGHSYKGLIKISCDKLDDRGMVIDFSQLSVFQDWINENFDHALILSLNDTFDEKTLCGNKVYRMNCHTTAENMCRLFADTLYSLIKCYKFAEKISISIELAETENNIAQYTQTYYLQ
jgi:6-pyruvoyltetrahydropterin/6-carboxytetrahydropterin synthase